MFEIKVVGFKKVHLPILLVGSKVKSRSHRFLWNGNPHYITCSCSWSWKLFKTLH